jgi:DNA-binding winged helix-turn-helix (wHTH) protein
MTQGFSKENQSSVETSYCFGEFSFTPSERLLVRQGAPVSLQPKAFDALSTLIRRAGHLVSKQELMQNLWPSVHVSEANLTNIIVSLRKAIGADGIQTVSKYGYRFTLPVVGEPGLSRRLYERFARAKELAAQRSVESMSLARELLWTCIAEEPEFAPAWAWLGRCCWFLAKFGSNLSANIDLAEAVFQRAFSLDPDLVTAHRFYTFVQADTGHAEQAALRLLKRLDEHPCEPESYAGLVHVLRFRGFLDESLEAGNLAMELDPAMVTSVAHTGFLKGECARAIQAYGGRTGYYLDAASWAAIGEETRAAELLRDRLEKWPLSPVMTALMSSLLAILERRPDAAAQEMAQAEVSLDPEILVYFARHYARVGFPDKASVALERAAEGGFLCAPLTLRADPWLEPLRTHGSFQSFLDRSTMLIEQSSLPLEVLDRTRPSGKSPGRSNPI